jgi:hypothetical protein
LLLVFWPPPALFVTVVVPPPLPHAAARTTVLAAKRISADLRNLCIRDLSVLRSIVMSRWCLRRGVRGVIRR